MIKIWSKVENELATKAKAIVESLNPPAEEAEVEALEEHIGQELPVDYRDFLFIHNGQSQDSNPGFYDMFSIMPLDMVQESWDELETLRDDIGEDDACPGDWLPFAEDGSGDMLCVELESGAVSKFVSDDDNEEIADSFESWLSDMYATLNSGEFIFDPSSGFGIEAKEADAVGEDDDVDAASGDDDDMLDGGDDDDAESAVTYKFTAKMIDVIEDGEKTASVPWGDINRVRVSAYAGEPLIALSLPEGNEPEEIELPANIPGVADLYKHLGKLKGWDEDAFKEALSGAGGKDEIVVWES